MANFNRIYATLLLIRYSLVPGTKPGPDHLRLPGTSSVMVRILSNSFAAALRKPDALLGPDNKLELLFEGASAPAAPFLLFYLKRRGFSGCKAIVTRDGILVKASR